MAPINGSAKPRRHGGSKLAQPPKTVVPAIPLPYVKRQAAAAAASAPAAAPASVAPTPADSPSTNPPATAPRHKAKLTNGSATDKARKDAQAEAAPADAPTDAVAAPGVTPTPAASANSAARTTKNKAIYTRPKNGPQTSNGAADANHQDTSAASSSGEPDVVAKASSASDHSHHPAAAPKITAQDSRPPSYAPEKPNGVASKNDVKNNSAEHPPARQNTKPRPPSAVSPTRYQMPPPFQPANRSLTAAVNGDMPRPHRPHVPNGPHLHQPHPSNSSIHFGTFHGSTSSSPAPPHSGGIAPPPGMPGPDGRPPYMGPTANGFPPMMPYSPDMMPTFDNYGRPSMGYGPVDSYPPYGNNFGPSTPHSFHDSQSSVHPDDNAMYQYPSGPARNGVAGPGDDSNVAGRVMRGPEFPRMMPNPGFPPHLMPPSDDAEGLIAHLQQQFGSLDFADCVLELRYSDDRAPPVRIPGHRLVLSRSPELANLMMKPSPQPSPGFPSLQTIVLETKSKWIRSDSFYTATQRLYGHPLFPIPPPAAFKQGDMAEAGSISERMDFALSYATAGHLLSWEPVVRRGCEIALQLINWGTLERALEFALEEHLDKGSHDSYKYGEGSRAILNGVVAHIVNNISSDFVLDASVMEPEQFRRFPPYPTPPASPASQKPSSPAIACGTPVNLGRPRRSQQITGIQFGDLSVSEGPKPSQQAQSPSHAVISRVLLNVPFEFLKMALESVGNNVNGWANPEYRYQVIKDVVTERERRRLQAVDAIRGGRVPGWESILRQLSTPEPRYFDEWSGLGWQEEMFPYGSLEGPILRRTWVPLMDALNGSTAEYP